MPRHFTQQERVEIEKKLLESAKKAFLRYGVNKTTIQDITDMAEVGKGTFYLFYKSKGDIYLKLYSEEWKTVHDEIDHIFKNKKGNLSELILDYIYENRRILLSHPILSMVYDRNTLALISDKAAADQVMSFRHLSNDRLVDIINSWINNNHIDCAIDSEVISGMMRSLSYLNYHKDEIGEEIFDEVIRKFAQGITLVVSGK